MNINNSPGESIDSFSERDCDDRDWTAELEEERLEWEAREAIQRAEYEERLRVEALEEFTKANW